MVSLLAMPLPSSPPPTTQPINFTTVVRRAAPTILGKRRSSTTSTVTTYVLPIPSVAAAAAPPPPPYGLPPGITFDKFAAATNATLSVQAPNPVNHHEWVPSSLHTDQPSRPTLCVDGGRSSMPIVDCHFISESAVYKRKDSDNNFINLDAFRRIITHYRAAMRSSFGEMFSPWSSSKLIVPFERHLYNNVINPGVVYDELKHPLNTPDMKVKCYVQFFMGSSLQEIVRL